MNPIVTWIKRHPLAAFFVLTYTISWLPWVLGSLVPASRPFVLYPFESGGPLLAALVVIPITQGRAGLRALGASMLRWRGVALPGLQAKRSPLAATLILALLVTGWHLPLALASGIDQLPPIALLATIAVTFWYAWVYNRTGGSALMTLVAHAAEGVFFQFAMAGFAGANTTRLVWLYTALWCAVAVGLLIFDRSAWRSRMPAAPANVEAVP